MAQSLAFFCLFAAAAITGRCACMVLPAPLGKRYIVGGLDGWRMPQPENMDMYMKWAGAIHFYVEDSIEFVYKNDTVVKVDKFGYYHCNVTAPVGTAPAAKDSSALFLLEEPGFVYFSSADLKRCKKGQRLMVNVEARPSPAPAPAAAIAVPPAAAPSSAPVPAPQEQLMMSAAASLYSASSSAQALGLVVSVVALALVGLIRA